MLPGEDGLSLCHSIRFLSDIPIRMLTARGERGDKVAGLEAGADDYVIKRFDPRELVARLHTILRRIRGRGVGAPPTPERRPPPANDICFGGWRLNRATRELTSPAQLLIPLLEAYDRTIDLLVFRLRQKLDTDSTAKPLLRTIRGEGYLLDVAFDA